MSAIPDTKILCRDRFCVTTTGRCRPKVLTFGCWGNMSPTCCRHSHPRPYTVIPTLLWSDFGVLGHLWSHNDVIMSWLRLTDTSNMLPTSILDIQSAWAHWYAVRWHTVAALHSFTHPTWLRFWGMWSFMELKWCIFVMVDADSYLKLLPTSIWDTFKVIEHIDMLSMGIQYQPYTVIPTLLGSDFGALGNLWSQHDEIMSWLRLTVTSNCFPHLY